VSKVDLHIHTSASDGRFSPAEIVLKAHQTGLQIISITDHDTIDGIIPAQQAARSFPGLMVIGGVEINTDVSGGELHLLCYFVDSNSAELKVVLERLRSSRIFRAQKMVEKLNDLGIDIDFQRVRDLAGTGAMGRPHVAQALLEKGYIGSFREAFVRYIGRGCPAFVEREKVTPADAVGLVLRAGGLPVLAHPFTFDNPESWIRELKPAGLIGVEAYYNNYSLDQIRQIKNLAVKYDLVSTGGSDFHGLDVASETVMGGVDVPLESAERLIALAGI
jgi:3',5'-nucleoside bisphosphate phosphatase